MSRLIAILASRWVVGLIGISALSMLIWIGADYIRFGANNTALSITGRIILIASCFMIWLIYSLIRWGLEQRRNKEMVEEISEEDKNAATVDPDEERSAEEIQLINTRFKEALAVLKKSRFKSSSGSKTLYQLPWYIIIGPPGAGKTTALVNSGLDFPLAESHGATALSGIGGTRNCDWWFTNNAVMIDTAGRYTTQDSHKVVDNNAWTNFLQMLKKYRPRRPVNGVLIAISIQEILEQTAQQRQLHAKTIRTRMDELREQFGVNFPVYLVFTKGDLVAGFGEFFANLSQAEREQVWGMTFPFTDQAGDMADLFTQEYKLLIERLNQRLLWRMDSERSLEARSLMQGFPNRMEALSAHLREFIATTFATNNYSESPLLRGVYFTSATQQGMPIDRMMAAVCNNFSLPQNAIAQSGAGGKSFFLNRLMTDVIFPESELVGTNRRFENILKWGRRGCFVAMALLSVVLIIVWSSSVSRNLGFMDEVASAIDEYESNSKKVRPGNRNLEQILSVLTPLEKASSVYDQEKHPFLAGVGLYDGRVDRSAKKLYDENLRLYFFPAFRGVLERELSRMTAEDPELPDTLGVYLMLSDRERQDNAVILAWATAYWQKQYLGQPELQNQLISNLNQLLAEPLPPSEADARILTGARQQLSRIPMSQRLYKKLQQENNNPVDLYQPIGGNSDVIFGLSPDNAVFSMPSLYTKQGYDSVDYSASSDLISKLEQDQWIYGNASQEQYGEAERKQLSKDIERAYLTDYAAKWNQFFSDLNIAPFDDLNAAVQTLQELSDPSYSPLLTALDMSTKNTQLRPALEAPAGAASELAAVAPGELQPTLVDKSFRDLHRFTTAGKDRPAPIQQSLDAIAQLKDFMDGIASDGNPGEAAYTAAKNQFNRVGSDPIQQLRKSAGRTPEPMAHWLTQLADHSWKIVVEQAGVYVSEEWNKQVYSSYADLLNGRYPLFSDSQRETALADFNRYFSADGVEKTFFDTYLTPFIDRRNWQQKTVEGQQLRISSEGLRQLKQAARIREALYGGSGGSVVLPFKLKPLKLDAGIKRFTLELASTRITYSHGPQISKDLRWTAGEDDRIRILFEDLNGDLHRDQFTGDWAWLRWLDASSVVKTGGGRRYEATFTVGSRKALYQLTAKSDINAFDAKLLRSYRSPRRL